MKGIDWENRKGGGTKKCTPQPVPFPSLFGLSPIWFSPLELIVSPIQNPSEPGLTPNLAAKWRKINDPWPDLKVFFHVSEFWVEILKKKLKSSSTVNVFWATDPSAKRLGAWWRPPSWCGNYCVSVWSQDGQESSSYLPSVRSYPMCYTFTCHYHHNTTLNTGPDEALHVAKLAICSSGLFPNKIETVRNVPR